MNMIDHDLLSIQEARILAENAKAAQSRLAEFSQEQLDEIQRHIARRVDGQARELAVLSAEETGCGRWEDKLLKNRFACRGVSRALEGMKCVGVIARNPQLQTMDVGVPRGPIAALCPAASPVSTAVYKALIAVKSGNSIVFAPHPRAKEVMGRVLDLIIGAAEESGLPSGAISYLHTGAAAGARELMGHRDIKLILMTGVSSLLPFARSTGKPVLYGGEGNGPAFIERTADVEQAVADIVRGKTFDYGAMAAAEQAVVVDAPVSDRAREAFRRQGGYFMTPEQAEQVGALVVDRAGELNPEFVGKSALRLAAAAGLSVPPGTRLLLSEQKYVSEKNPYARGMRCPVLAYYVERDWREACEKCIELLVSQRQAHTLVIHSRDLEVIRQFALKKPVSRLLVNTPAAFGGVGMTTNFFPAMTLGGGAVGQGMTTDNVSPMNLIYIRKVGWGVRAPEACLDLPGQAPYSREELAQFKRVLKELVGRRTQDGRPGTSKGQGDAKR